MSAYDALPPGLFDKVDDGGDLAFYAPPRLVTHIDEHATLALTNFYRERLPSVGRILDLMSSWISHLKSATHFLFGASAVNWRSSTLPAITDRSPSSRGSPRRGRAFSAAG